MFHVKHNYLVSEEKEQISKTIYSTKEENNHKGFLEGVPGFLG